VNRIECCFQIRTIFHKLSHPMKLPGRVAHTTRFSLCGAVERISEKVVRSLHCPTQAEQA
jgi:hypothetical protein